MSSRDQNSLARLYEKTPVIQALLQLIPYLGGPIHTLIHSTLQRMEEGRIRALLDALSHGKLELSEELIESEDFLHCFCATYKAVLNTRRREKIELFARLLKSAFTETRPRDIDEFEEFISILDDLTYEEWCALTILDSFSSRSRKADDNDLTWSRTFWDEFSRTVERQLKIPSDEFTPFMNRLGRTGLYDQLAGAYLDYAGGVGKLTPRFHRLKSFINSQTQ